MIWLPFASQYNENGSIAAVKAGGGTDNEPCLALAFREGTRVVAALKQSVAYWAPYTKTGCN